MERDRRTDTADRRCFMPALEIPTLGWMKSSFITLFQAKSGVSVNLASLQDHRVETGACLLCFGSRTVTMLPWSPGLPC